MSSTREMYDSLTNYCKSVHSIKENEVHEKSSLFNFTSLNIDNMPPVNYREKSEYKNSDVLLTRTRRGSADMSCKKSLIGTNSFPIQELDAQRFDDLKELEEGEQDFGDNRSEHSCPEAKPTNSVKSFHQGKRPSPINIQANPKNRGEKKKFEKTKNLLRNFSKDFHKYLKYNMRVNTKLVKYFKKHCQQDVQGSIQRFLHWVSSLQLKSFVDYTEIWTAKHQFIGLYRQLCFFYYRNEAFCDIYTSRRTKQVNETANEHIHKLIKGFLAPKMFFSFQ